MEGIDLNKPITYLHSSLRFFNENERHVNRFCKEYVLLLVYEGILRFSEDDVEYELYPGQYHIQKINTLQKGNVASRAPKYLYVHFFAELSDDDTALPFAGGFHYEELKALMNRLDMLSHNNGLLIEKTSCFFEILLKLRQKKEINKLSDQIAVFISKELHHKISLDMLCEAFHYSKNHIINVFKEEYNLTPFEYINNLRIQEAEHLLEVTSDSIHNIAQLCGFDNYSHFYRLFRRKNAVSPVEWRNGKRIKPIL